MSRIVFMGTPDFSVPTLLELVGQGHEIAAVYTRAPQPAGRGMAERKSPVHEKAESLSIPVLTPKSLRGPEAVETLAGFAPEVVVVVAYGLLLPQAILDVPEDFCLNLHASLLPRWRGAAPINRAIMEGDRETGVMVMKMEKGLDTGPVAMAERIAIEPEMTAGQLHDRLAVLGADLMVRAVAAASRAGLRFREQGEEGVTYAAKLDKGETRIDWSRPAQAVHDHIRGLSPFPGAHFEAEIRGKPVRVKALRSTLAEGSGTPGTLLGADVTIACGTGAVRLLDVQRQGKGAMTGGEFLRGTDLQPGDRFS
ncbi:MAG: methionyl-tRNA formyltransferase [Hyphomicrobiaceae bacterium]|nr:methionyl-tRNA formyltransferase [Hyphomicrobiaceae bacterium]